MIYVAIAAMFIGAYRAQIITLQLSNERVYYVIVLAEQNTN
jgi:hypothetical protein